MHLLYAADLAQGGTASMRMETLRDIGCHAVPFDMGRISRPSCRLSAEVLSRLQIGPYVRALNADLLALAKLHKPDVVWIDKGLFVNKATLSTIRSETGAMLVHYNPDDPFGYHSWRTRLMWRTFIKAIPSYDLHFVPKVQNVEDYRASGAKKVVRFHRGYCPSIHKKLSEGWWRRPPYVSEVCFPGARERERESCLAFLAERRTPLAIWGRTWKASPRLDLLEKHCVLRTPVGEEYAQVINGAKICLNFLRRANRDLENSRTFEIPACGTFLLGERNEEQLALFSEGKEAEFFSSPEELLEKVGFYLAHDESRRRIAEAGHARCLSSCYTYHDRLRDMLAEVRSFL